jgi:hypothetical protein
VEIVLLGGRTGVKIPVPVTVKIGLNGKKTPSVPHVPKRMIATVLLGVEEIRTQDTTSPSQNQKRRLNQCQNANPVKKLRTLDGDPRLFVTTT